MIRHSWVKDKSYKGIFHEKAVCKWCGCEKFTTYQKTVKKPFYTTSQIRRQIGYFVNGIATSTRPKCTGPPEDIGDIYVEFKPKDNELFP